MRRFGLFPVIDDAPPANNGTRPPASQRTNAGRAGPAFADVDT